MRAFLLSTLWLILPIAAIAQEIELPQDAAIPMTPAAERDIAASLGAEDLLAESAFDSDITVQGDRVSFRVRKTQRGTTLPVPESYLVQFCSDLDGCKVRLGMFNWDNTGRVASRETLLFFNRVNRAWRASAGDRYGTDYDGTTQHVLQAWACYFTDGRYEAWKNQGDSEVGFGLLSWNQYNAECFLTIID